MAADREATVRVDANGAQVLTTYEKIGDSATQAGAKIKAANDAANSTAGKVAQGVSNAFGVVHKNLTNFSFQIQDAAVQLQGGQSPLTVLMQQGTQIASLFGPAGALIGAVGAGLGLLGGLFLSAGDKADDAKDKTHQFGDALNWLGKVAVTTSGHLSELISKYREAGDAAQQQTRLELERQQRELEGQVEGARGTARTIIGDLPLDQWRASLAGPPIPLPGPVDPEIQAQLDAMQGALDAIDRFNAGGSLTDLVGEMNRLAGSSGPEFGQLFRAISDQLLDASGNAAELEAQLRKVKDELAAIGSVDAGVPFPIAKPDEVPADDSPDRPTRSGSTSRRAATRGLSEFDQAQLEGARLADLQTEVQRELEVTQTKIIKRNQLEQRGLQDLNNLRLQAEQQSMQKREQYEEQQRRIAEFERPIYDPLAGAQDKFAELADSSKRYGRIIGDSIQLAADTGAKALSAFVLQGKEGIADLAKSFADQLLTGAFSFFINALVGNAGQALFGAPGNPALVTPGSTGSSAFTYGGPRASGGDVRSDRWYWVGERGPERFYPDRAGHVEPAGAGGGGKVINQIIDQRGHNAPPVETQTSQGPDGTTYLRTLIRGEVATALATGAGGVGEAMKGTYGARRRGRR